MSEQRFEQIVQSHPSDPRAIRVATAYADRPGMGALVTVYHPKTRTGSSVLLDPAGLRQLRQAVDLWTSGKSRCDEIEISERPRTSHAERLYLSTGPDHDDGLVMWVRSVSIGGGTPRRSPAVLLTVEAAEELSGVLSDWLALWG